jgi:GNAT superfamily N-acetyltransferase
MSTPAAPLIRPITEPDWDHCANILAQGYRSFVQSDGWDAQMVEALVASQATRLHLGQLAASQQVLVALWQNEVAGFLSLLGTEVTHLYVDPHLRRHGLGSLLLQRAQELARAAGQERLRIFAAAFSAVAFYERAGFRAAGEITITSGPCSGRTAIRLVQPLTEPAG